MLGIHNSLVNTSLSQSIGNRQAEEQFNANQAALGTLGLGAAKLYWGSGPGSPFVDVPQGRGGGGNPLDNSFRDAYNAARQANEQRYADILKGYQNREQRGLSDINSVGGHERTRINQAYDNLQGSRQQGLVGGAFNSTVRQNMNAGVARERTDALGGLEDRLRMNRANLGAQLSGDRLGFMERRNDNYPDLNQLLALRQGLGAAGAGMPMFGGGGGGFFNGSSLYGMPNMGGDFGGGDFGGGGARPRPARPGIVPWDAGGPMGGGVPPAGGGGGGGGWDAGGVNFDPTYNYAGDWSTPSDAPVIPTGVAGGFSGPSGMYGMGSPNPVDGGSLFTGGGIPEGGVSVADRPYVNPYQVMLNEDRASDARGRPLPPPRPAMPTLPRSTRPIFRG